MKKKIGYVLLTILVTLLIFGFIGVWKFNDTIFKEKSNYLEYTFESQSIHFDWAGDSIAGIYEPQAAIVIPLRVKGFAHQFYMQFDTGAYDSFIYEKNLKSLSAMGLDLKVVEKDGQRYVENFDFHLGDNHIKASMIKIYPNYGHAFDKNDTISSIGIGTIGSDFITNRITAIDFKNQKLDLYNTRPNWMAELPEFKPFDFKGRRIMLPVTLDDKNYEFLYDSGCSAFGLITIKSRYNKYTDHKSEEVKYNAKSWESSMPIHSKTSNMMFKVGNANLKLKRVSYVDMYTTLQPIVTPFTRIGGWMGNQPFNESTLIIDTKTEAFLVIKE